MRKYSSCKFVIRDLIPPSFSYIILQFASSVLIKIRFNIPFLISGTAHHFCQMFLILHFYLVDSVRWVLVSMVNCWIYPLSFRFDKVCKSIHLALALFWHWHSDDLHALSASRILASILDLCVFTAVFTLLCRILERRFRRNMLLDSRLIAEKILIWTASVVLCRRSLSLVNCYLDSFFPVGLA